MEVIDSIFWKSAFTKVLIMGMGYLAILKNILQFSGLFIKNVLISCVVVLKFL